MWHLSTSLSYVNVTGPRTGVSQNRFSSGSVPTLLDVLKRTSEEFTPMRTTEEGGCQRSPKKKIRTVLLSGSFSLFFSFCRSVQSTSGLWMALPFPRFSNLTPLLQGCPFSSTCPPRREKYSPLLSWEFVHALKDDHVVHRIHLHFCPRSFVRSLLEFWGMHAGAPVSWKRTCELSCVAPVSQH